MTDPQKLARVKRIAMAHATPASNVGAHRLAQLIVEVISDDCADTQRPVGDSVKATHGARTSPGTHAWHST